MHVVENILLKEQYFALNELSEYKTPYLAMKTSIISYKTQFLSKIAIYFGIIFS